MNTASQSRLKFDLRTLFLWVAVVAVWVAGVVAAQGQPVFSKPFRSLILFGCMQAAMLVWLKYFEQDRNRLAWAFLALGVGGNVAQAIVRWLPI